MNHLRVVLSSFLAAWRTARYQAQTVLCQDRKKLGPLLRGDWGRRATVDTKHGKERPREDDAEHIPVCRWLHIC
ncbi:hypothetical protein EV356DRAFT_501294 [Viridothelium virens]|uniref:Secreted protein n=1 Tax=Viridothelium virens TaxID=1048519 RepID=A0A6A6H9Q8_VIRVR|nr:hypothetical protein EV356DRAFT_501294 [Viridothelium virens]